MTATGPAKTVTIFVGHDEGIDAQLSYHQILELLKAQGAAGATVFKSIVALGVRVQKHSVRLTEVVPDLPITILWIDTPEQVERILPSFDPSLGMDSSRLMTPRLSCIEPWLCRTCHLPSRWARS